MSFLDEGDRNPYNPRTNITLGVILVMVVGGGSLAWSYHDAIFGSGTPSTRRIEGELQMAAQVINQRAPIRVDEVTTLTGATARGTDFTYNYTLSQDIPSDRIAEARQALERDIGPRLCADRGMSEAVRGGAVISADYRDPSGDHIRVSFRSCPAPAR
jgi:hypothetical protein